jgi:hypothetical protein
VVKSKPRDKCKGSGPNAGPPKLPPKSAEVMTPSLNRPGITEDIFEVSCLIFNQALNRGEAVAMAAAVER